MASNRHLGRIIALQTLYEAEFRTEAGDSELDVVEVLNRNISRYREMVEDLEFIRALVDGVTIHAAALDIELQPVAPEWPIDQIARMDRIVLRIGLYELKNESDVPAKVVINEAVELAKAFGGDNSSKFVNGVLGTLLRNRDGLPPKEDVKSEIAEVETAEGNSKPTPKAKKVPAKKSEPDTKTKEKS
jgi:N utilization substance protein B